MQLLDLYDEGHCAHGRAARTVRTAARRRRSFHVRVWHRRCETHVLPALRHPLVLYAAVEAGWDQRERALPGGRGYRRPEPEPVRRTARGGVKARPPRSRKSVIEGCTIRL